MDEQDDIPPIVRRAICRGYEALNRPDAGRARGPAAGRIEGGDDTFRVDSCGSGERFIHA